MGEDTGSDVGHSGSSSGTTTSLHAVLHGAPLASLGLGLLIYKMGRISTPASGLLRRLHEATCGKSPAQRPGRGPSLRWHPPTHADSLAAP